MKTILRNAAAGGSKRVGWVVRRLLNLFQFQVEQMLLRGAFSRLLVIRWVQGGRSFAVGAFVLRRRREARARIGRCVGICDFLDYGRPTWALSHSEVAIAVDLLARTRTSISRGRDRVLDLVSTFYSS